MVSSLLEHPVVGVGVSLRGRDMEGQRRRENDSVTGYGD